MRFQETSLSTSDLSQVRWRYARLDVEQSRGGRLIEVLKVSLSGPYAVGAAGRKDARVLYSSLVMGWLLWPSDALLLDVTGLDYVWGDDLLGVLEIGSDPVLNLAAVPVALHCAEWNRSAFQGLIEGIGAEPLPYLTTDGEGALAWIAGAISN